MSPGPAAEVASIGRAAGRAAGGVAMIVLVAGWVLNLTAPGAVGLTFGDQVAPFSMLLFALVGTLLASRRSRNPFGWVLIAFAGTFGVGGVADGLLRRDAPPAVLDVAAWAAAWTWVPAITILAVGLLLFPDGRLPSRRWRVVLAIQSAALGGTLLLASALWSHRGAGLVGVDDQWPGVAGTIGNLLLPLILVGFVGSLASLLVRYRTAGTIVRLQLKWLLLAVLLLALALTLAAVSDALGIATDHAQDVLGVVGLFFLPVAIGIAVLRYRLFEIDRIISRTLTYALVTAVLIGVYVGAVVGVGALLPAARDSDLPVALSTLVVAGLFQPVRRRVQTTVDRRFDRVRYDATRTAEAFAQRLRNEVDLGEVSRDLARTVRHAVAPASISLWLPQEGTR